MRKIRTLSPFVLLAVPSAFLGAVACSSVPDASPERVGRNQSEVISDQLHNGGTTGFFFVPPFVAVRGVFGDFVPAVAPTIVIDQLDPVTSAIVKANVATFTMTSGPSGERIRTHLQRAPEPSGDADTDPDGYFVARWDTDDSNLAQHAIYRVRVLVPAHGGGTRQLGFADVDVVRNTKEFRSVDVAEYVPLIDGHLLRIKFRIDRPAVDGDGDGIFDWTDNCPTVANPNQKDTVGNGIGDACRCATITCLALDQCHAAGACVPTTGQCSTPPKVDGTACSDGNACTQIDTCQAGACVGNNPLVCPPPNTCRFPGTCDPGTGACSQPAQPDGAACNGGACQAGACVIADPASCTGKPDGAPCDDHNACTQTDVCQRGQCSGQNPVFCTASDQCHTAGICDPGTGVCPNPASADGTTCDDGDACTQTDTCQAGACMGNNPVVCCGSGGVCEHSTGTCSYSGYGGGC